MVKARNHAENDCPACLLLPVNLNRPVIAGQVVLSDKIPAFDVIIERPCSLVWCQYDANQRYPVKYAEVNVCDHVEILAVHSGSVPIRTECRNFPCYVARGHLLACSHHAADPSCQRLARRTIGECRYRWLQVLFSGIAPHPHLLLVELSRRLQAAGFRFKQTVWRFKSHPWQSIMTNPSSSLFRILPEYYRLLFLGLG